MGLDGNKVRGIYSTLQKGGYTQDYDAFLRGFTGSGNYANRKKVYDLLAANGADVGGTYEEFMRRLSVAPADESTRASSLNSGKKADASGSGGKMWGAIGTAGTGGGATGTAGTATGGTMAGTGGKRAGTAQTSAERAAAARTALERAARGDTAVMPGMEGFFVKNAYGMPTVGAGAGAGNGGKKGEEEAPVDPYAPKAEDYPATKVGQMAWLEDYKNYVLGDFRKLREKINRRIERRRRGEKKPTQKAFEKMMAESAGVPYEVPAVPAVGTGVSSLNSDKMADAEGGEQFRFTDDPEWYGITVDPKTGKRKSQWLLGDGSITDDYMLAANIKWQARQNREYYRLAEDAAHAEDANYQLRKVEEDRAEIKNKIARLKSRISEAGGSSGMAIQVQGDSWSAGVSGVALNTVGSVGGSGAGGQVDLALVARLKNDLGQLETALRQLDQREHSVRQQLRRDKSKDSRWTFGADVWGPAFVHDLLHAGWDFGLGDFSDQRRIASAQKRISEGRGSSADEALVRQQRERLTVSATFDRNAGAWERAFGIAAQSAPFMLDFVATGGGMGMIKGMTSAAVKGGVKAAGKGLAKAGMRSAGEKLAGALEWLAKEGTKRHMFVHALGVTADDAVRASLMVNTIQAAKTQAEVLRRMNEEGMSYGDAMMVTQIDSTIENISELFGVHLEGFARKMIRKGLGSALGRQVAGMADALGNIGVVNRASRWGHWMSEKAGYNGYLGEVAEEYYGQLLRTGVDIDTAFNGEGENSFTDPEWHRDIWLGMALGAPVSAGMGGGLQMASRAGNYLWYKRAVSRADEAASRAFVDKERWEALRDRINNTKVSETGSLFDKLFRRGGELQDLSAKERSAVLEYMTAKTSQRADNLRQIVTVREQNTVAGRSVAEQDRAFMQGYRSALSGDKQQWIAMAATQRWAAEDLAEMLGVGSVGTGASSLNSGKNGADAGDFGHGPQHGADASLLDALAERYGSADVVDMIDEAEKRSKKPGAGEESEILDRLMKWARATNAMRGLEFGMQDYNDRVSETQQRINDNIVNASRDDVVEISWEETDGEGKPVRRSGFLVGGSLIENPSNGGYRVYSESGDIVVADEKGGRMMTSVNGLKDLRVEGVYAAIAPVDSQEMTRNAMTGISEMSGFVEEGDEYFVTDEEGKPVQVTVKSRTRDGGWLINVEYADGTSFEMEVSGEDIENDIVNFATLDARDEVDMSQWEERWEREADNGAGASSLNSDKNGADAVEAGAAAEAAAPEQEGGDLSGASSAPSSAAAPGQAGFKVGERFAMKLGEDVVEAEVVDVDDVGNVTVQMQTGEGPIVQQFAPDFLIQLVAEASPTEVEAASPDSGTGASSLNSGKKADAPMAEGGAAEAAVEDQAGGVAANAVEGVDILDEGEVYKHTPEEVWAALVAACGGNVGMARQIAESNVNDHRTEAEKETKKAPNFKGMTTQQKIEAMSAREALIAGHENAAEFWRAVVDAGESGASSLNSDKKADSGETGETEGLSWSDERAGNGEPFLIGREGSIDLVDIPQEVFDRMGVAKAPFRLTPSMVVHVFERHKKELKLTSYKDAVEAVLDVMRNFDHVRQGRGNTYVFSVEGTRKNSARRAVTFVLEYDEGSWLGIKTVGYERISNLKELTTLWEKGEGGSSATGVAPANVSSAQSSQGNRTDGIASNQSAVISDGKGSDLSSDKQEDGEESSEVEPGVVSDEVRDKWQSARKVVGLGNEITVGGRKLRGHYVLVEAGAATPSHDWRNGWRKSKGYPMTKNGDSINDRNYERDRNAQAHTENDARNYDGRAYSSDVVVTRDGVVLSGNGRTMAGEIAARNGTDTAHNEYLAEYGARFGFSREQVEEFEHPRVLFELEEDLPYTTKTMSDFNQTQQKGQAREDLVEKYGKMVSDDALSRINRIISDFETMDEFYRNEKAVMEVLRILQGAHIIEERKTNEMWEGESISDEGRNLIEATLLGKVFSSNLDTARQLMRMPAQRNAVLKALPVLVANFALGDEFSFAREFTKAVQLVSEGIQGSYRYGSRVSEQVLETAMFGGEEELSGIALNTEGMREFAVMFLADMINHRRSSLLAEVLGRYNELAAASASGQAELFSEGVPSRSEMVGRWKEALRLMESDRRREFDDRQTERERKTGKKSNEQYKPNYDVDYYEKIEQNGAASESDGGGGERTEERGSTERSADGAEGGLDRDRQIAERRARIAEHLGEKYGFSEEKANNGEVFYANERGDTNLAQIPGEIFDRIGHAPVPFKLTETMAWHVYRNHAKELKLRNIDDAIDFVLDIINNVDHVRLDYNNAYIFSVENGREGVARRAIAIVINSDNGEFMGIKTSGFDRMKSLSKRPVLWEKGADSTPGAVATPTVTTVKAQQGDEHKGSAEDQNRGVSSEDKISDLSSDKQEDGEKSSEEGAESEDFGHGTGHSGESETEEETEASSLNGGKKADAAGTGTGSLNDGERGEDEGDGATFLDVVRTLYEKGKEFASGLFKQSFFDVAGTPRFMKELGLLGEKFTIRFGVISRHFGKDSDHKLPLDVWQNLPEALQNPFAITRHFDRKGDKVKPKGFRIYTALRHNGKYVIVGADVKNIDRNLDINAIETAFAITNPSELEEIIYTSENITPEQLALLNRRNSDQYPASREDSDGKGNTLSSDKQEDGEKSSEEGAESEDFGHGTGHSGESETEEETEASSLNGGKKADAAGTGTGSLNDGERGEDEGDGATFLDVVRTLYEKGKEFASGLFKRSFFDVAGTPKFMKELGLTGDKFTIRYGVIARHFGKDSSHDLDVDVWKQLPEALQRPFAITRIDEEGRSAGRKGKSFRLYTTLRNNKGEYVVVGVDVKNAGRDMEVNAISTIFGRRTGAGLTVKEVVIYTDAEITPEQLALLDRPNSDQYPASRENSDGKGSDLSSDKQEDGKKSSEEGEESEDFGHGPQHSGGTEAGTAEEDERKRRDDEEEREKQEAERKHKDEERKREAAEEKRKREEEKARREAEREARLRELMGRELTEGEIDSAEGFDETIKNLAKGFLRGKKSALSTVAYNKIKEDVRNKQLESEGDSEVADGTHVGGTPDDAVSGGTGRGSGEGGGLDSENDGKGGAERGPGGKDSAGVVASAAGAGGAVAVAGEASGGESVDSGDGERRGGDRVGGSDVRDSGGESGGGEDAGNDGLHGGGAAGDLGAEGTASGTRASSLNSNKKADAPGTASGTGASSLNSDKKADAAGTGAEAAAPNQDGGKSGERTGRGERTTEDVDRDLRDALGELGDILKGIGKGRANDITTVIAELIVKAPQLITAGCKVGYFLLERGFRQFKKWHARFKEVAGDKFRDAGLSDEVIDQLIEEFWNSPYAIDGEILTIAEWAEEMTREELRRAVSKSIGEKIEEQRKAEGIAVKIGDIANIRETLPFLLPQQHEDVEKAERQFFDPSHADREHGFGKGYMFTNGTGTGKTFTGLGIVKRFLKQGKGRVLIVTASEKKINDWISDAKKLGIEASMLEDTKSKGRGVVVTQYANMRQNDAILEDEFDLIVYDESHKLMENQTGSATATSEAHFLVSNRDVRSAITRSFRQHPVFQELRWKMSLLEDLQEISLRPKSELSERLKAIAKNYRSEAELNNAVETTSLEIERLSEELERLIDEAMQDPEKVAAAERAVARTKVVFLSATPFNTPRNLEYVEGYIFSYEGAGEGSGDFGHSPQHGAEAGGTGASSLNSVKNGDGTERRDEAGKERDRLRNNFLMRNFPSSHTYDKKGNVVRMADARIADAEKAGAEEVAFSDRLQNETETMSGRIIDSMYDYSREFPVMDTPIMPRFNQAISEIDNGKYSPLKEFFGHFFNDYNTMTAYMEAIKTSMVIDRVMEHIRLGRKVAVYHRRKSIKDSLTPPFDRGIKAAMMSDNARVKQLAAKFVQEFPDLFQWEQTVDFRLPVDQILSKLATEEDKRKFEEETIKWEGDVREAQAKKRKRVPKRPRLKVSGVGVFNGDIDIKEKEAYVDSFNDDDSDLNILVCQVASAKEGISLHDTTGKHQRVMVNLFLPQSPIEFIQTEGRIYRIGNRSDAIFEYPILGFNIELWSFINKINGRSQTSENLALGSMSRGLRNSIAASVRARRRIPVTENMGKGGKLLDSSANQNETDYDGAIRNYQEWKGTGTTGASSLNSGKKADAAGAAEGTGEGTGASSLNSGKKGDAAEDGVEIPDPVGYVMVALGAANTGEHAVVPFASTGTIARYVPNSVRLTALEGDMGKFVDLAALVSGNGRTVLDTSLEKWHVSNKCDVIVMNAPHSRVRPEGNLSDVCQDEDNIIRAFSHLEEGGRVVAVVARENMAEVERFVDNTNAAVMREVIAMPAFVLNGRESRIVVIDKISNEDLANEAKRYDSGQEKRDFSNAGNEDELFKAMRDVAGLRRFIDVKAKIRKRAQSGLNKAKTLPTVASSRDYSSGKMRPDVNDFASSLTINFKKGRFRVPARVGADGAVLSYYSYFNIEYDKVAGGDARYIMELCRDWVTYDLWSNLKDDKDVDRLHLVDYRNTTGDKLGKTAEEVRATAKVLRDLIGNVLGKNEMQIRNMAKGVSENAIYGELSFRQYSEALRSLTGGNAEFEELNEKVLEAVGRIEGIQFRAKPGSSFGPGVLAHYSPFNNSIEINEGIFNSATVNDDMKRQTLLHEMIHAVTSYAMRIYESGRTDLLTQEQIEACQDIFEVYRQINNSEFAAQLQLKARGDANATYGLTSAYEMMAELSNPIFRSALKAKSLWRQLVNGIRRLLGMDVTGEGVESTALDVLNDALERLLSNFNGNAYREYLAAAQRQQGGTMEEDEDWLRIETDEMMVGDEVSEEGLGNKKTPFTGQPDLANEKSASGSVLLSISGDSSSNAAASKEAGAKLAKDTQSTKEKIRKFKNGDYDVSVKGFSETIKDLSRLLSMRTQGASRYSILKTLGGKTVAVRLSDHVANGDNFRRDNADSNISIVIERRRFDVPTGEIVFTEAVIPMSVYEARPSDVVDAIVNGVDDVLNDKAFTLPSDMGTVEEKGGGPTEIELLSEDNSSMRLEPTVSPTESGVPHRAAKLLKGVEKSYDKGKYLLEESEKSEDLTNDSDKGNNPRFREGGRRGGNGDFDSVRERAVAERGIVMPGLNEAEVRVVDVPRHDFTGTGKQALQAAEKWAKENIVGVHTATDMFGEAFSYSISNDAVEKYVSKSATKKSDNIGIHLASLKKLPEIISESMEVEIHADYKKDEKGERKVENGYNPAKLIHRFYGAIILDGRYYRVKTTIEENADKSFIRTAHSYEVTEIEAFLDESMNASTNGALTSASSREGILGTAKLLKGVEKSYDKGKLLLEESDKSEYLTNDSDKKNNTRFREGGRRGGGLTVDERKAAAERVAERVAGPLGVRVRVVASAEIEGEDEMSRRKREAKGWFDVDSGEVVVVADNHVNGADVEATVLHEVVGHRALREMIGDERFGEFLDGVYRRASKRIRREIDRRVNRALGTDGDVGSRLITVKKGEGNPGAEEMTEARREEMTEARREAVEEYIAELAERGFAEFDGEEKSFWRQVVGWIRGLMTRMGLPMSRIGDNQLRYMLWRSYQNLRGEGGYIGAVRDAEMRRRSGVVRFRSASPVPGASTHVTRAIVRARYDEMIRSAAYQVREAMQDSQLGLRRLMEQIAGKGTHIADIAGFENAYLFENRMGSTNLAEQHEYLNRFAKPLIAAVDELLRGVKGRKAKKRAYRELTEYMIAKHGLERNLKFAERDANAAVAADATGKTTFDDAYDKFRKRDYSGLTALTGQKDVEAAELAAQDMVDSYESSHDTSELWSRVKMASTASLEKTYRSGWISEESFNEISAMFDFYIPLQGWDEKTSDEEYAYLHAFDSRFTGKPIRHAEGRRSLADDPLATLLRNADEAIRLGNRNIMKQRFLNFVLNHPSDAVAVNKVWFVHSDITGEWEPVFADLDENDTHDEVERKIRDFENTMEANAAAEPDKYKRGREAVRFPMIVKKTNRNEHQVIVRRNGEYYVITILGNPRAAQCLNGETNPDSPTGGYGAVLNFIKRGTRWLSANFTTRNPDFIIGNFFRDLQFTATTVWAKEGGKYGAKYLGNLAKYNPGHMARLFNKWRKGTLGTSGTEGLFRLFMTNGGETGYTNVRDLDSYKSEIMKELKTKGRASAFLKLLLAYFDVAGRAVENSARFATFVTSMRSGRSLDRSIWDAKEVSVNFNKKGTGGRMHDKAGATWQGRTAGIVTDILGTTSVFFNAGIQGMTTTARVTKKHPVAMAFTAAGMMAIGFAVSMIGQMFGGGGDDDDEEIDYLNLPDYVRRQNVCLKFPGSDSWITVPISIEHRALYGLGDMLALAFTGRERKEGSELLATIAAQLSQTLPIDFMEGGEFSWRSFVPSVVRPFADMAENQSWTGLPIYKETPFNKENPEWTKAYSNADNNIVSITRWLNEATGGDDVKSGWLDLNPSMIEYGLNGFIGGPMTFGSRLLKTVETAVGAREHDWRNYPLVNRLVKSGDERMAEKRLNNEWFRVFDEYKKTKRVVDGYNDKIDNGYIEYAERFDLLTNSKAFKRYEILEDEGYVSEMESIAKEMKECETEEEYQELKEESQELKREALARIKEI